MSEHTLEELSELAKPALRHVELVDIARTESPNKADELASVRWPRRQAKATRFLAMVRRDYGNGAFTALTLQMEHARPQGTEHAQGATAMVTLDSMYPEGVRDVVFGPEQSWDPEHLTIWVLSGNEEPKKILLKDEIERLKLDENQVKILVRRIIDATLAQWSGPKGKHFHYYDTWAQAIVAARAFLPDETELYQELLIQAVIHIGGYAKHSWSLAYVMEPEKLSKLQEDHDGEVPQDALLLQMTIDHMLLGAGISPQKIMETWREMLKIRFQERFITGAIICWWEGLEIEGFPSFETESASEAALLCLMRDIDSFMTFSQSDSLNSRDGSQLNFTRNEELEWMDRASRICWRGAWKRENSEAIENLLIEGMSRGQAAKVAVFLARFGETFHLYRNEYATAPDRQYLPALQRVMRGALIRATEERRFGIASALAEQLGELEEADSLREKARHLGQLVALDFVFCTSDRC